MRNVSSLSSLFWSIWHSACLKISIPADLIHHSWSGSKKSSSALKLFYIHLTSRNLFPLYQELAIPFLNPTGRSAVHTHTIVVWVEQLKQFVESTQLSRFPRTDQKTGKPPNKNVMMCWGRTGQHMHKLAAIFWCVSGKFMTARGRRVEKIRLTENRN